MGRKFFDILTLTLVLRAVREFDLPGYRWVGLLILAKNGGYGIGLGLAGAAAAASNAQLVQAATILPVLILVLIACFVWLLPERTLQNLLEAQTPPESPEPAAPTLDDGVRRLAQERGLTPREQEVLGLLARGRTEAVIMERLAVSKGTAHTHVTHVYQKLQERGLTPREQEVLGLLARGRTEAVIMERLAVSKGTAHTHVTHVYQKLGVHGQQELIEMAENAMPTAEDSQNRSS